MAAMAAARAHMLQQYLARQNRYDGLCGNIEVTPFYDQAPASREMPFFPSGRPPSPVPEALSVVPPPPPLSPPTPLHVPAMSVATSVVQRPAAPPVGEGAWWLERLQRSCVAQRRDLDEDDDEDEARACPLYHKVSQNSNWSPVVVFRDSCKLRIFVPSELVRAQLRAVVDKVNDVIESMRSRTQTIQRDVARKSIQFDLTPTRNLKELLHKFYELIPPELQPLYQLQIIYNSTDSAVGEQDLHFDGGGASLFMPLDREGRYLRLLGKKNGRLVIARWWLPQFCIAVQEVPHAGAAALGPGNPLCLPTGEWVPQDTTSLYRHAMLFGYLGVASANSAFGNGKIRKLLATPEWDLAKLKKTVPSLDNCQPPFFVSPDVEVFDEQAL